MNNDNKPTREQLKELYEAAIAFKQEQPWSRLYDSDVICLENPVDKTIAHCSVMGRVGDYFAVGVYFGDEGICNLWRLMGDDNTLSDQELINNQNCLMCSFEDRSTLTSEELKQIKDLGLSFRGKKQWPIFCRYEPGFFPWYINKEECIFLTHALKQILIVSRDISDGKLEIDTDNGETILRYSQEQNGKLEWYNKKVPLMVPIVSYSPVEITDELLIYRIKKAGRKRNLILQADICYFPAPVQNSKNERPYYPRIFLLLDKQSGLAIRYKMFDIRDDDVHICLNELVSFCMEQGVPGEIIVRGEAMETILDDFCNKTNVKLTVVDRLPDIDNILEEMASNLPWQ